MSDGYTLYGHVRSGNSYKPALMLALTGTPFEFVEVDLVGEEQKSGQYRDKNVFAKVPMLTHGRATMRQSGTILLYLAAQTGQFGSDGPLHRLQVSEWMFWEQERLFNGVGRSRFFRKVAPGDPAVLEWLAGVGNDALDTLEAQLVQTKYLTGDKPTIADINCYCYARLAEEGSFEMGTRPATVAWREAMEALPGWAPPAELLTAR
ncbi:MAG: glutathione S-transferase [Gammaproteobacteria bacterium]|nr:glutathione S-transferase [Gammaproteobacteria bacterium]